MLATGEFCFLNTAVFWRNHVDWSANGLPKLWAYHLNYFDFLNVDLESPGDASLFSKALRLAVNWCDANPSGYEEGWEPYPLSLRIVNWLKFFLRNRAAMHAPGEDGSVTRLLASLRFQALVLEGRLEKDLLANHLLKNIKALMFAGAVLIAPESYRWWATGERLLQRELSEQILADGGHFERSPMYHMQVLEDLLDLRELLSVRTMEPSWKGQLDRKIAAMGSFARAIVHPDQAIPLLNDSAFDGARSVQELLPMAEGGAAEGQGDDQGVTFLPYSGYGVIRDTHSRSCLVFDCGPLGPDYQPGHGHCDVLSYELSLNGQRVVVDTGVSTYDIRPRRHYERSTAAHNTVRVDGEEQAEIWASFRVGRRPNVSTVKGGEIQGIRFLGGSHNGYKRHGVVHTRNVFHLAGNSWIVSDGLEGNGLHTVESFIHFHPSVEVKPWVGDESCPTGGFQPKLLLTFQDHRFLLLTSPEGEFELTHAWYSPEFGRRDPQRVARWSRWGGLPARLTYMFVPAEGHVPSVSLRADQKAITINNTAVPLI